MHFIYTYIIHTFNLHAYFVMIYLFIFNYIFIFISGYCCFFCVWGGDDCMKRGNPYKLGLFQQSRLTFLKFGSVKQGKQKLSHCGNMCFWARLLHGRLFGTLD